MSTPLGCDEKTSRATGDMVNVTDSSGKTWKISNQNYFANLPVDETPFDIDSLDEISSLGADDFFPLLDDTDGQPKKISAENLESEIGGGGGGEQYPFVLLKDIKTSGTDGGTFSNGAQQTRDLTTKAIDTDSICTLSSNQFTLPAGTYWIDAKAIAYRVNAHKLFIYDTDGTTNLSEGASADSYAAVYSSNNWAFLFDEIVLSSETTLELQHECETTRNTDGMGQAGGLGSQEEFAMVKIWKVA